MTHHRHSAKKIDECPHVFPPNLSTLIEIRMRRLPHLVCGSQSDIKIRMKISGAATLILLTAVGILKFFW